MSRRDGSAAASLLVKHAAHALWVERLPAPIEMTGLGEGGCDLAQAHAPAGLGARPVESFRQGDGLGSQLPMRLAPFTLPQFFALPLASVAQLVNQPCFLILGEGTGDLAHLPRQVVACGQSPEAVSNCTPRLIRRVIPSSWAISSRANRLASSTMTVRTPLPSIQSRRAANRACLDRVGTGDCRIIDGWTRSSRKLGSWRSRASQQRRRTQAEGTGGSMQVADCQHPPLPPTACEPQHDRLRSLMREGRADLGPRQTDQHHQDADDRNAPAPHETGLNPCELRPPELEGQAIEGHASLQRFRRHSLRSRRCAGLLRRPRHSLAI